MTFDLDQYLPYRLYQAAESTGEAFHRDHASRFGIGRTDWRVLFNIGQYGPISAVQIAGRTNVEKTRISRSVQRLVVRGWVERVHLANDRRRQDLGLTPDGRAVFMELRDLAATFNAHLEALLEGSDVQTLIAQLRVLEAGAKG